MLPARHADRVVALSLRCDFLTHLAFGVSLWTGITRG